MLVLLEAEATRDDAACVTETARGLGLRAEVVGRPGALAVAITGGSTVPSRAPFEALPHVLRVEDAPNPYFLASRSFRAADTVVDVGGVQVGGERLVLMAGPCAVESEEQLFLAAEQVQKRGIAILRAGAYKLRTSPWAYQGEGERGIELLAAVKRATGLRIVTEVVSETTLASVAQVADLVQIGARNMKNYELLKAVGRCGRPALLKRGPDATVSELLLAAEYLLAGGSPGVILCERGIRTFSDHARNTLDLAAIPVVKRLSHLPILVDPSHASGSRELVLPLSLAGIAVGADGLLVEVHPVPELALSDGAQALRPEDLDRYVRDTAAVAAAIGRKF